MDGLQHSVAAFFTRKGRAFGLDPASLDVSYVLNWGGFVNHSFRVTDGRTKLHLKLATSDATRAALERWYEVGGLLQTYHAPPILAWVDIGDAAGLLFPVVDGSKPALSRELLDHLSPLLARLWADDRLAAALPQRAHETAADYYLATYHDRFTQDLRLIHEARPEFVPIAVVDFLENEVQALADRVRSTASFQEQLHAPVHGDLWLDNILWEDGTSWYILDWDDLAIGDPAADLAMLLGPTATDPTPLKMLDEVRTELPHDVQDRLPLLGRASVLDWVIDPLADWIDADAAGQHAHQVRPEKQRVHEQTLGLYHERYGRA